MNNNKFILNDNKGIQYYTIKEFEDTNLVKHLFTTRIGGENDSFFSLNLGINGEYKNESIINNFNKISNIIDSSIDNMVCSHQLHTSNIRNITKDDMGKGLIKERNYKGVDGMITNEKEIALVTFYGDCVPLFYLDKRKKVVGLAHGGWRGTVEKIAGKMVSRFVDDYGSNIEDIIVGIGPSIRSCCYEVGKEVYEKFNKNFTNIDKLLIPMGKGKWKLDLASANRLVLEEFGVLNRNIIVADLCTSCNNDKFFSYRKESGTTGRMAAFIKLI
ncbi:peptidoglycan editing factor PgeF [Dethiothermospora halolimnae]|uniref:peptidoglycan editing factor PgeF n=1 Tax=Dethiothermospora halolimnae TaxID=3114390 RepID=UPI003CCB921A